MKIIREANNNARIENIKYSATSLAEAFYGASGTDEEKTALKDIEEIAGIFSGTLKSFIKNEPMFINGRIKMDKKDKDLRVDAFIKGIIKGLK